MAGATSKTEKATLGPPPDYSRWYTHWQLLGVVGTLMTLFLMIKYGIFGELWGMATGNPEAWSQFTGGSSGSPIDTRLPRTSIDQSPFANADDAALIPPANPTTTEGQPSKSEKDDAGLLRGYDTELLKAVVDNTVFRPNEVESWYRLCALVGKTDSADLEKQSLGRVLFAQLFNQSAYYRGRVVTLTGQVRRAEKLTAEENDHGVTGYTKCVMFTNDGANSPVFVYVLEMPASFPLGDQLREDVTLHGVYYKRQAYPAQDVPRTAPLVVAKTLQWTPPAPKASEEVPWLMLVGLVVLSAVLGLTIAVVALRRLSPEPAGDSPGAWAGLPKEHKE